ncbi:tetratricopeptide repeat protein, partial [Brevundimonas kwangchunensis]|uniref:tetratricopeptide repeat protein n=1 Tax=Brevundimonas kwangchunensis TaxID=322163 RepID=UPI003CD0B630
MRRQLAGGDAAGALSALDTDLRRTEPPQEALTLAARACRMLGRHADAAAHLSKAALRAPNDGFVAHNLAAALGDCGQHARAIPAARSAIALRDAPESWLVLGKALQTLGDLPDARHALEQAAARRPGYADALQLLSQLIWMTTGDAGAALAPLRAGMTAAPSPELAAITCGIMKDVEGPEAALTFIGDWTGRGIALTELAG